MKNLMVLVFLMIASLTNAQNALDSAWIKEHYTKIERMVPMRDGIKLYTAIYVPNDRSEQHPFLLNRTTYSCAPYGETNYRPLWNSYQRLYLRENCIMVYQDVRGRYKSEGVFEDVRPFNPSKKTKTDIDESSDTYDTIDWLLKNIGGNNGKVGSFGTSYPGFYATMAALSQHPALVAVSPQAPVTDWFMGDDFHHNGAFFLFDAFSFYSRFGIPRPKPVTQYIGGYNDNSPESYDFYLKTGAIKNFTQLMGDSIKFWNDLMAHPTYDSFWKARNPRNYVADIKPAILIVGGLFDAEDCFGAWRLYQAIEGKNPTAHFNKIVMGPWHHGQWSTSGAKSLGHIEFGSRTSDWYQTNIEVPFFLYHLKGKGDISTIQEATVFMTGENTWKTYPQWPPAAAKETSIYFQDNGQLNWDKPLAAKSSSGYSSDPAKPVPYIEDAHKGRTREYMLDDQRFASRRTDVLTFQTTTLTKDMVVTGTVIADLKVSLTSTDADFVVKIIDVFPDDFTYGDQENEYPMGGYQMLVRGEIMRGKFRNSFENPQPFTSNTIEQVKFDLPDISHTFKKGHKLMIQVQSSWFPLADRNPQQFMNIYEATDKDFKKSYILLHHDSKNASRIILPILNN